MDKGLDSLIETTVEGLRKKQDFSSRWCEHYTEECVDKLKDYTEKGTSCGHDCEYCKKFKWVIDRAKSYEEKLNISWTDILASWEKDRSYWYLNYYQNANQPEITSDKVRVFETVDEMLASIGDKKFRCPACGGVSTNPYSCNSGVEVSKATKKKPAKICDWKVYGLFGDLDKGVFVYCKDKLKGETIFTPLAWESTEKGDKGL